MVLNQRASRQTDYHESLPCSTGFALGDVRCAMSDVVLRKAPSSERGNPISLLIAQLHNQHAISVAVEPITLRHGGPVSGQHELAASLPTGIRKGRNEHQKRRAG